MEDYDYIPDRLNQAEIDPLQDQVFGEDDYDYISGVG